MNTDPGWVQPAPGLEYRFPLWHQLHKAEDTLTVKPGAVWSTEYICSRRDHIYLSVSCHQPRSPHTLGNSLRAASNRLTSPTKVRSAGMSEEHITICRRKAFTLCVHKPLLLSPRIATLHASPHKNTHTQTDTQTHATHIQTHIFIFMHGALSVHHHS